MPETRHHSTFQLRLPAGAGGIVIVGSGLAGLFTALKLAPMPVTVLSAAPLSHGSSSRWAQGGIAAAVAEGDSPEAHAADTLRAGAGIVDPRMARLLAAEAGARIEDLLRYGVPFDRDLEGRFSLSHEAAHSARRVLRVKGDMAGAAIMDALTAAARATPSIQVIEGYVAHRLSMDDGRIAGVSILPVNATETADPMFLRADAVVLASGGIGHLYAVTTNPVHARGDGIAMAARAGAVIADPEFVQFHPTAFDVGRDPAPLASETLRGEGAILVNRKGERFMTGVHRHAELVPRDIVARAVHREIRAGRGAFLDCRAAIGSRFAEAFPAIHAICRSAGLDPVSEPLPVAPAAHYHMGGVLTDADGRTTLQGLWACGEVASTGVHGANRLASNSLLETVVFGARIAENLSGMLSPRRVRAEGSISEPDVAGTQTMPPDVGVARLRTLMTAQVGVERTRAGLAAALRTLAGLERAGSGSRALSNMVLAARFATAAAYARQESRGGHFRSDFPEPRPECAERSFLTVEHVDAICAQAALSDAATGAATRAGFGT